MSLPEQHSLDYHRGILTPKPAGTSLKRHPSESILGFAPDTRMYQDFLSHLCWVSHSASPLARSRAGGGA